MHENEAPIGIHCQLLAFYGEDTVNISTVHHWVRKSRDSGGNLDLNGLPWCGMPGTATYDLYRQKVTNLLTKNGHISQRAIVVEKLNNGLASVSELFAALGYPRPHTSAVTSVAIASDLKSFCNLPTAWVWHLLTSLFCSPPETSQRRSFHL